MIFPSLTIETLLQVEDKTRLDAQLSFISGDDTDSITDVLIQPEITESFISVYDPDDNEKWYLDWAYQTDGFKDVTVRVTTVNNPTGRDRLYSINVLTEEEDALFSKDSDIYPLEPSIKDYLPKGKNSFLYAHRKAQEKIIAYLDEQRIWKIDGSRYTKQDIYNTSLNDKEVLEQFNQWSTFETLLTIYEGSQVSNDDIFNDKMLGYQSLRNSARNRSALRLDANGDGELDQPAYDIRTLRMVRR